MLASSTATDNWRQGAIHKAYIINGNVTKYIIASFCLKDDLEGCSMAAHVQFSLQPLFAWQKIETQGVYHLCDTHQWWNVWNLTTRFYMCPPYQPQLHEKDTFNYVFTPDSRGRVRFMIHVKKKTDLESNLCCRILQTICCKSVPL